MNSQTYERQIRHRLTILRHADEVSMNVAATCRYYGISRPTFYKWERRFKAEGPDGLRERSKAPKNSPHATNSEVVGKIIYLRQNYHSGPQEIAMNLARYHDVTIIDSGVWRILKKFELNRLPTSQRYKRHDRKWKRYEKQLPGHQIQIDVKFVDAIGIIK
jgi:transposase